jgi:predicted MPP superfamily phosphohydrolase
MPSLIMANLGSTLVLGVLIVVVGGAVCVAYGVLVEHEWYRSTRWRLRILPPDAEPLALLHLSDLHFTHRDRKKRAFLSKLDRPDVTVITGDFLAEREGVEMAVEAVRPLRGRFASYVVLGSNDYFVPRMINPLDYVFRFRPRTRAKRNRWRDLVAQLEADGWTFLRNQKADFRQNGTRFEVVGLDDPHINWQDLRTAIRERPDDVGLAVVHSPDPAPELAALGYRLILAGHTHGGQVRMPFVGALISNGSTPPRLAMGLSRLGPAFLHVSPGLGTSKYAPFRFLCRPEATYIDLLPATARV